MVVVVVIVLIEDRVLAVGAAAVGVGVVARLATGQLPDEAAVGEGDDDDSGALAISTRLTNLCALLLTVSDDVSAKG